MSTTRIQISPAEAGRRMTLDEFEEADEQPGYRYELARGVLEVTNIPGDLHGQIVHNIHEAFSLAGRQHPGLILRIAHGSDVRLLIPELESGRHPDLGVVFHGAPGNQRGLQIPALVVEVVSPGKAARARDYQTKREEYLVLGIQEFGIVDPSLKQLLILSRRAEADGPAWTERTCRDDDPIVSGLLPALAARLSEFWAETGL